MKRFFRSITPKPVREFLSRHKRHIPTAALLLGLIWDSLTLGRPDQLFDNAVLLFYLILSGAGILVLARRRQRQEPLSITLVALIQFAFGNLTSGLFILYGISGTIAGNWPFLLLLVALLVGNELLRSRYGLLRFNVAIYYLLLFSYLALVVPVLLREIGTGVFLLSGIASLIVIALFLRLVRSIAPDVFREHWYQITLSIGGIFVVFNLLYLLNLVPPVPLAAREVAIYHHVERLDTDGNYAMTYEKKAWYEFWRRSDSVFHRAATEPVYCYSAIFAPAGIETTVYHSWEHFDEASGKWEELARIPFVLEGGRDEGYRGFSIKTALPEGAWRCDVETERGTLIGRRGFKVERVLEPPELTTVVR